MKTIWKTPTQLARELRKNMTPTELILWRVLRNRRLNGIKFLRQHVIYYNQVNHKKDFFIVDFYCAEYNLVIEVDGLIHRYQHYYDKCRDDILQKMGYHVLRINVDDFEDVIAVKKRILAVIEKLR